LTRPEPASAIEPFFERLDTSSDAGVQHADAYQPLLLVNLLRAPRMIAARGWRVFREDLGGFAAAWVLVIVLVVATVVFLR